MKHRNDSGIARQGKAEEVKNILRKLNSLFFCLSVSGCGDVCNLFDVFF